MSLICTESYEMRLDGHDVTIKNGTLADHQADRRVLARPDAWAPTGAPAPLWRVIEVDFDTPGFGIQSFPVIAVDQAEGTFTVEGDHSAFFPETAAFGVRGSTGNDADGTTYRVASVTVDDDGNTIVGIDGALTDDTADGELFASGMAGIVLAPAGSAVFCAGVYNTELFDGSESPYLTIGERDFTTGYGVSNGDSNAVNNETPSFTWYGGPFSPGLTGSPIVLAAPLIASVSDNEGNWPLDATQGKAVIVVAVLDA